MPKHDGGGRAYDYSRFSAEDQNFGRQHKALVGVDVMVDGKISGKNREDREELSALMAFAQSGDTIRTRRILRLASNTRDLLAIVEKLVAEGVCVEFVDTPMLNVTTKEGRATLTAYAAFAELERESIR